MSEYSELIKKFDLVRDCMRDFYVFGFQSRQQLHRTLNTSERSYDNQRRRIESYLADYMAFHQDREGKRIFLSVDSADIEENPLYRAFKAKSFTKNDLFLHFALLDLLTGGGEMTAAQMIEQIDSRYLAEIGSAEGAIAAEPVIIDPSTLRKKLKEYKALGLLRSRREGKQLLYALTEDPSTMEACSPMERRELTDALRFFAETTPLGVVGSYILDRDRDTQQLRPVPFGWKHHYIMHALESQVVWELLDAMHRRARVEVTNLSAKTGRSVKLSLLPLRILISVQSGRRYAAAYDERNHSLRAYRLDYIKEVRTGAADERFDAFQARLDELLKHTWGVSFSHTRRLETLEMEIEVLAREDYIVERLHREGRHGTVTQVDETHWKYEIQVWDATEMIPWLRTFLGRIVKLRCTDEQVTKRFYEDMDAMFSMYGVEGGQERDLS